MVIRKCTPSDRQPCLNLRLQDDLYGGSAFPPDPWDMSGATPLLGWLGLAAA